MNQTTLQNPLLDRTRRHFFRECGVGIGSMALGALANQNRAKAQAGPKPFTQPFAQPKGHFPGKAKSVIYLFMAGGPSQLELFEYKPELQKMSGKPIPDSFTAGKRFAFMDTFSKEKPKLLGTQRKFKQHGKSGAYVSELLPEFAKIVDEVAILKTVATDVFNHAPAKLFANTGSQQFGRPSMGSWVTYGLGSESQNLPGFVVLQSGPRGPRGGAVNWGSGFLPTAFQGVPLRSAGEPILNLANPKSVSKSQQQRAVEAVAALNQQRMVATGDQEIATRVAAYEMAFRMQTSAPDLIDFSSESAHTLALYGVEPGTPSFASQCLLARRMVERGVRFVQLYHSEWDHHGGPGISLNKDLDVTCRDIDRPMSALIYDLKARGLLDETLVVWGGEFGRTPMGEIRENTGRNHHIDTSTMWMAGGGIKPGIVHGKTDEFGFGPVEDRVHMHDIQATILNQLGLEHTKLTYRFQGRDFRLTDVEGQVISKILA
ncbi:MAG: DUF1501 domain-containing protein [Gemmataceae bacterium]|nr:DUF1501 domain-containing protein [Gemmataceae bacterium]